MQPTDDSRPQSFTGVVRARTTSRRVRAFDRLARWTITAGGVLTIVAVATVCFFLVWVALPLVRGGSAAPVGASLRVSTNGAVRIEEDPYRRLAWVLRADGDVVAFATADGREVTRSRLFDPARVRSFATNGNRVLLGGSDGQVQFVTVDFATDLVDDVPSPAAKALGIGEAVVDGTVLFERTPEGQLRRQELVIRREEPTALAGHPIEHVDFTDAGAGTTLVAVCADGSLHTKRRTTRHDLLEDRDIVEFTGASVALASLADGAALANPDQTFVLGRGDVVVLLWNDGRLVRLDTRDLTEPRIVERIATLPTGRRVASTAFLSGKTTMVLGDDLGAVHTWFATKPDGATTLDGVTFVNARSFPGNGSAAVGIATSKRSRLFAVAHADGSVRVWHGTSERLVAAVRADDAPLRAISLSPKEDGLLVAGANGLHRFDLRPGHPEATLATVFRPVWYEGAAGPAHAWQSTGGSDDFEPKLGLMPLIFGTLKATFYCLLFGVPLALLAAIYTSEFLHPRWRSRVKPAIELMASLPSVVLGFLAGLVLAPFVSEHLTAVLLSVLVVPFVFVIGAQVWQQAPPWLRPTADRLRVPAALLTMPLGIWLATTAAPLAEAVLFRGDLKNWLAATALPATDARRGSAFGGFLLVVAPIAALLGALATGHLPVRRMVGDTAFRRFLFGFAATTIIALLLAGGLTAVGCDLRGNLFGVFDPRNSLVVGLVMGFAVVPIVYTIAEDALAAVPEHLRAASLGAGATPWQTAVRVVFPTAMSGIFSAIMVGLGRAVGETMIVVMAVGGTAIMDPSVFNGFRTLSANIATELPEAVRDSTHYRLLYLAALCLFVMTFVLNTLAELVRQRFRKRAFQL